MPIRISRTLLIVMIAAVVVLVGVRLGTVLLSDRDGWGLWGPVEVSTEPLVIEPRGLLARHDQEDITDVVESTRRDWALPWSIRVVREDTVHITVSQAQWAEILYERNPVETSPGADDGLLMLVIVPEDDHTQTTVEFYAGENFYPKGGITPERLDDIADVQMATYIEDNRIGDAVLEGATWVEWTQLFEPEPDAPPTTLERGLQDLLVPYGVILLAGLIALLLVATGGVIFVAWRGTEPAISVPLSGITAAAAAHGRADHQVIGGILLDAIDRGVVEVDHHDQIRMPTASNGSRTQGWDRFITAGVAALEAHGQRPCLANLARFLSRRSQLRGILEDELAANAVYHPKSAIFTFALRCGALAGITLGLIGLVLAVIGESAPALACGIALSALSLIVLIWNEHRSWTTKAGRHAAAAWRDRHQATDDRERMLYEAIMAFDQLNLKPPRQSPIRPDIRPLIPALRD